MEARNETPNAFRGERLREARESKGITQRALARLCGIADTLIYRYEHGVGAPQTKHLTIIAEKLGVSMDYLVGLADSPNGHLGDGTLSPEEMKLLETFRHAGWRGVVRLGADHIPE